MTGDDPGQVPSFMPSGVTIRSAAVGPVPGRCHPAERERLGQVAPARVASYCAGRTCARAALEDLGFSDFLLFTGVEGAPVWPPDIVGSLSHCADLAVAAATGAEVLAGVGVDVERRYRVKGAFIDMVARPDESSVVRHLRAITDEDEATTVFSLKEAIYKCAFPMVGRLFGFQAVRLSETANPWTFQALVRAEGCPSAVEVEACLRVTPDHVFSGAWIQPKGVV